MTKDKPLTAREEANALTCAAFRFGFLERLHEGKDSKLTDDQTLSRITDPEMKKLMIETSERLADWMDCKADDPDEYWKEMWYFHQTYTKHWIGGRNAPS